MMYRPKSSTLSILERAQGQLSGKRFGQKSTSTLSHQKDEQDEEEDELKAYLSQLQKRTTHPVSGSDTVDGDDAGEIYQPKTSTPIKSGSQFLKSNRRATSKPSPAAESPPPSTQDEKSKGAALAERRKPSLHDSDKVSDISDDVSSAVRASLSEEELGGYQMNTSRWRKRTENLKKAEDKYQEFPDKDLPERNTPVRAKSAAFDRIMSNLGSDNDDVEDLINSVESDTAQREDHVPLRKAEIHVKKSFKIDSPPTPDSISQSNDLPIVEDIKENVEYPSESISTDVSDSSQGEIKLNILQAADLRPAIMNDDETDDGKGDKTDGSYRGEEQKRFSGGKQAWLENDQSVQRKQSASRSAMSEEVHTDTESEINSITENDSVREADKTRSDEDTDKLASSYSSIASHRSRTPPSHSSKTSSHSRHSSDSEISKSAKKTPRINRRSRRSRNYSTSEQASYSEDFDSDSQKSRRSVSSSSRTLTVKAEDTSNRSPTPSLATPSPAPKERRTCKVKDTGVQTSNMQYNQSHWIFDHVPPRQSVDVSELLKDFQTASVAPETLHAVSSINYTSLLLHQTLKLQYQQTQQSIQRMLSVHQSLLESVQSDYAYTTLEDTKAVIQRHRENGKI